MFVAVIVVLGSLIGVVGNRFVAWDDDHLIVHNGAIRDINLDSLRWMFTTTFGGHYQPLTWLSYAFESKFLWGINAAGFHFTNLILHTLTAIGLFLVVRTLLDTTIRSVPSPLTKGGPRGVSLSSVCATIAALLWAIHPLRVESVAWATERRDVLSGTFLVFSVFYYLRLQDHPNRKRFWIASISCYILSLLSKSTVMTLPIVLLILDAYPLRRELGRRVFQQKAWYVVPALAAAILAAWAQASTGAMRSFDEHPPGLRIAQACFGVFFYLAKTVWPANLVPLYEQRPDAAATDPIHIACILGVTLLTSLTWSLRKRHPALLAAWTAYLVLLSPMLGLAQSGPQVVADRYSYLPSMALMVLVGAGFAKCWSGGPSTRRIAVALAGVMVVACMIATRGQVAIWRDTRTLWEATLARRPDTPLARANYAVELNHQGEFESARVQCRLALERLPGNRTAHAALARASLELGDLAAAERHGRIAIEIAERAGHPDVSTLTYQIETLLLLDRRDEAETYRQKIIQLDRRFANVELDQFDRTKTGPGKP